MPEEVDSPGAGTTAGVAEKPFDSPPPAPAAERREFDPRQRLHDLALALLRTRDRRLLVEYLQLRRAVR